MNILFLYPNMNIGGAQKVVLDLVNEISNKTTSKVYLGTTKGKLLDRVNENVIVIDLPLNQKEKMVTSIKKIVKIVKENSIDIVHSHHRYTTSLIYLINLLMRKKVNIIHTEHSVYKNKNYINLRGKNIIAVSDMVKQNLISNGVKSENIFKIYNGVDNGKSTMIREEKHNNIFNIGVLARLSPEKGHIYLIKAVKNLINIGYKINLNLIGDGELKNELKKYVAETNMNQFVKFHGDKEDIYNEINKYDFFVLPSVQEGLPLSILEIMANSKIIICTDVGGNREIINNNTNGFIINKESIKELEEKIKYVIDNYEKLDYIEYNAKKTIESKFTIDNMILEHCKLYDKVLRRG
ncbi:glycosyltransferase [Clostridium sp. NSJ-6]|uniref:Glycosyltransferase n=1 Tax=Clostridium hominis TaxID=2763036 RepID=A0ABR7DBE4_9CLOT|nr:glycosyltransferase [Clostridium hominis]MBC5628719.1 glycosyltransferase [Clostridium hominis]